VAAEQGLPQSTVVFLDGGVILGNLMTDSAGTAVLTIPVPRNGVHSFTASFSGDSQFAPSVSPELQEVWPDSGPGFSVAINSAIMRFNGGVAAGEVSVTTAGVLQDAVHLSCASGLPVGYSCRFEPSSLSQGGISHLSIRQSVVSRNNLDSRNPLLSGLGLLAVLVGGLFVLPRRRALVMMATLFLASLGVLSGCGGREPQVSQIAVVTVQATSGTGQALSVHSAQLVLMVSDR
jgi:hypothetical protein